MFIKSNRKSTVALLAHGYAWRSWCALGAVDVKGDEREHDPAPVEEQAAHEHPRTRDRTDGGALNKLSKRCNRQRVNCDFPDISERQNA